MALSYYCFKHQPFCLSRFLRFDYEERGEILNSLKMTEKSVQVICYCLMPNHFHLILRQNVDGGISKYLSDFQNSYTRYFNVLHGRDGGLFLNQFKAVAVESESQLVHLSRYIHLNPYVASVVKILDDLPGYPWSSFGSYAGLKDFEFVEGEPITSLFRSPSGYQKFVLDEADYRRNLKRNEKLLLDFG